MTHFEPRTGRPGRGAVCLPRRRPEGWGQPALPDVHEADHLQNFDVSWGRSSRRKEALANFGFRISDFGF